MFDCIGEKIKGFTMIICIVGIVASIISGLGMMLREQVLMGLVVMVVGSFSSWVGCFLLYGFGELIDSAQYIASTISRQNGSIIKKEFSETWNCPHCGKENSNVSSQCKSCGKYRS